MAGNPLIDEVIELLTLLQHVHTYGLRVQSDEARKHAHTVAEAASKGFISTRVCPGGFLYGRLWKITVEGLTLLDKAGFLIADQEASAYQRGHIVSVAQAD